ncbi:MAG TPA: hypothetical protein VMX94_12000 [Armatimonadota bacterium]|nr:hypothetical protein [Armatimonadota bacterium]
MRLNVPYEWHQDVYVVVYMDAICPACESVLPTKGAFVAKAAELVAYEVREDGLHQVGTKYLDVIGDILWSDACLVFATMAAAEVVADRLNKPKRRWP